MYITSVRLTSSTVFLFLFPSINKYMNTAVITQQEGTYSHVALSSDKSRLAVLH